MTMDSGYSLRTKVNDDGLEFSFSFESVGSSGIEVFTITNGVRTQLTQFLNYNVILDQYRKPVYKSGFIRLNEPLPTNTQISIERKTPITLGYLAEDALPFESEQFEHQLDRFTMILQEIEAHACDCRGE